MSHLLTLVLLPIERRQEFTGGEQMLTATYTLVAMSVEAASLKASLGRFQALVHGAFAIEPALTPGQVDYACSTLHRLYEACHGRKVELYLAPEVRGAGAAARAVLAEL